MYYGNPWGMMGGFGLFAGLGAIISLLFWVLIILLIVRLIRRASRKGNWHRVWGEKDAMEILRERFARGEINKEEFEERKRALES